MPRIIHSSSIFLGIICLLSAAGCSGKEQGNAADTNVQSVLPETTAEVDTMPLINATFTSDIISNGKVHAREAVDIFFRTSELISEVLVHNGQRVAKGQPLARLDMYKLTAEKTTRAAALEQAKIELQDVLIGQGYDPQKPQAIPAEIMELARTRSGLKQAETAYETALRDIEQATLTAPFNGVVANVKGDRHSMASTSEPFCRIINDAAMTVEFPVLESELPQIQPGEEVDITPFSGGSAHRGTVTEINPLIDDNGHVTVTSAVADSRGLIDGMNVRIRSKHSLGDRLLVPKKAVVLRSGRQVVFTYSDGKAIWNYVTTGLENFDSYEITEGLEEGMTVIVSGNENLAHEAPVSIK